MVNQLRSRIVELEGQLDAERQMSRTKHEETNTLWEKDKRDLRMLRVSLRTSYSDGATCDIAV